MKPNINYSTSLEEQISWNYKIDDINNIDRY